MSNMNNMSVNSNFIDLLQLDLDKLKRKFHKKGAVPHSSILEIIYDELEVIDIKEEAAFDAEKDKIGFRHYLVSCIQELLRVANENGFGICSNDGRVYMFNGEFWKQVRKRDFEKFLSEAAEKMGVSKYISRLFSFKEQLMKQFLSEAIEPEGAKSDDYLNGKSLINLKNGTLEISGGDWKLRKPRMNDFMKYQLSYTYDEHAKCPMFDNFLNTVLPDVEQQMVLLEYLGYLFVKPNVLNLEKSLILYGTGANGKSVLFNIVNALLGGRENVSNYSLQNLTNESGYYRAMIGNKLVNYSSEINGRLEAAVFKQLVSCEPVDARLPYGEPFTLTNYAKLIFNCNTLPNVVENSHSFFRRFLILTFGVTIPVEEQDSQLAHKIIESELPGVLNRVLGGLDRLLSQRGFTKSIAVNRALNDYKEGDDTVEMFLNEEDYEKSENEYLPAIELYEDYKTYCFNEDMHYLNYKSFIQKVREINLRMVRHKYGLAVFCKRVSLKNINTYSTSDTINSLNG